MPWKETDPMNQKALFIADYLAESCSITELCESYGISRKTAYKWIDRFLRYGPQGLDNRSQAPRSSPHRTPAHIEQAIVKCRRQHPSWGAKKLLKRLNKQYPSATLPARSTVCDILTRNRLISAKRHRRTPAHPGKPIVSMDAPNQTWCADYKGQFKLGNGQYCYPLTITDAYSRFLLSCKALDSTLLEPAMAVFTAVFRQYGLPSVILTDNGSPFAANSLGRLTRLSAWWIQLGITPALIEPGKPQQNGRHERMHRTLKYETTLPPALTLRGQQRKFNAFINEYNFERPHEALDQETPANFYQHSEREYPAKILPYLYPDRFETRLVSENGGIRWRSNWINVSSVLANKIVGLEEFDYGKWNLYYCHVKIGILDERLMRILDHYRRTKRK